LKIFALEYFERHLYDHDNSNDGRSEAIKMIKTPFTAWALREYLQPPLIKVEILAALKRWPKDIHSNIECADTKIKKGVMPIIPSNLCFFGLLDIFLFKYPFIFMMGLLHI